MVACGDGYTNIVQLLLDHDADNNLQNEVSTTGVYNKVHKLSLLPHQGNLLSVA